MLLNAKLNDTADNIMLGEAVHTCVRVHNSKATTDSMKIPLENVLGGTTDIIGSFSDF